MSKKVEEMNIYERLYAITEKIKGVSKNLTVDTGKGKGYKAVAEGDVLKAVKEAENEFRVYSYPSGRKVQESQLIETQLANGNTALKWWARIETSYTFVNIDNPSETVTMVTYADGIDSQDKGMGKAMTYCDKYALLKAYKIETGDDLDQEASTEQYRARKQQPKPQALSDEKRMQYIQAIQDKWSSQDINTWENYFKTELDKMSEQQYQTILSREKKA